MGEPPKDLGPNPDSGKQTPRPETHPISAKEFNAAGHWGRSTYQLSKARAEMRLTPFIRPDAFPNKDLIALIPRKDGQAITPDDVKKAELASFSLTLDAAAQINAAPRPHAQLREDTDSLRDMDFLLKKGQELGDQIAQSDRQSYFDSIWSVASRREQIPANEPRWSDEKLHHYSEDRFKQARLKVIRGREAVDRYLGR